METINRNHYKEFRELFISNIEEIIKGKNVALAMSGGIDSMSIFFALLELRADFECYTFYQEGFESEDLLSSKKYCKYYGIKLNLVKLASDNETIYKDIQDVIPYCGIKLKKTKVETLRPLMQLFKQSKHSVILNGSSGDDYQPYKRAVNVLYQKGGDALVLEKGFRKCVDSQSDAYDVLSRNLAKVYNIDFVNCYAPKNIEEYFLRFGLKDILKPHKHLVTSAFDSDFKRVGGFRLHSSYQVNSRLRDFHENLLKSEYNTGGHRAVIGLYNQMAKELKQLTLEL